MMLAQALVLGTGDADHAALATACHSGVGLCTIVGIDGSFSRRIGAQMAILPDGSTVGSMADGCLEAQLAADMAQCDRPRVIRYGRGSGRIDFRLPCGGGLDILLDPEPDRLSARRVLDRLSRRLPAELTYASGRLRLRRAYIPALRIVAMGEGPELAAFASLCAALQIELCALDKTQLALGRAPDSVRYDPFTACLLLFHDHEWELPLLRQALSQGAFYVGAQGGERARINRTLALASVGESEEDIARIASPVGTVANCKTPQSLALSALAEIVGKYERLRDRA